LSVGRIILYGIYPVVVLLVFFRLGEALYWKLIAPLF
jgi:hypothetical protein